MNSANERRPVAEGDLSRTPFAHLLLYVHSNNLSGTLIVQRGGFETKVVFRDGRAVAAKPLPRGTELSRGLLELCSLDSGAYAFWEGDLLDDAREVVRGTVNPYLFLAASLKGHVRDAVVASVVDRFAGIPLKVVPDFDPHKFGLRGPDAGLAQALKDESMDPETASARGRQSAADVRRLLYMLLVTQNAMPADGSTGTSGVRAAVTPSGFAAEPPRASPRPGNPRQSGSDRVRSSRPAPSAPAGPLRPSGSAALRTGSNRPAWQQLASMRPGSARPRTSGRPSGTAPPRARDVPSARAPSPSEAPLPVEALDRGGKLRRAEQLAERKKYVEAARILEAMLADDDSDPDVHAARAWVLYQQLAGQASMRAVHDACARALRLDAAHPRALYIRGLAYKRDGRETEARSSFRRALDADADHIEARRELRLARMRRRK